jgi:hypothetical protein
MIYIHRRIHSFHTQATSENNGRNTKSFSSGLIWAYSNRSKAGEGDYHQGCADDVEQPKGKDHTYSLQATAGNVSWGAAAPAGVIGMLRQIEPGRSLRKPH